MDEPYFYSSGQHNTFLLKLSSDNITWGYMRYFMIINLLPTVEAGQHTTSSEKQRGALAKKLSKKGPAKVIIISLRVRSKILYYYYYYYYNIFKIFSPLNLTIKQPFLTGNHHHKSQISVSPNLLHGWNKWFTLQKPLVTAFPLPWSILLFVKLCDFSVFKG